jgi:hypothetical protein
VLGSTRISAPSIGSEPRPNDSAIAESIAAPGADAIVSEKPALPM